MFPTYLVGIPLTRVEWGGGRDEKAMRVDPNVTLGGWGDPANGGWGGPNVTPSSSRCTRGAPGDDTEQGSDPR